MSRRCAISHAALAAVLAAGLPHLSAILHGQTRASTTAAASLPRTPWGAPDLQGVWDYRTITPLQRPDGFAGKTALTDEEAAAYEARENQRQNRDLVDRVTGNEQYQALGEGGVGGVVVPYNEFWYDRGHELIDNRTSLIVDPPDGRIPALVRPRPMARAPGGEGGNASGPANPEDLGLGNRCIARGAPRVSGPYNNNIEIVQSANMVVLIYEMAHDARIIPLDGRPHLPQNVRQWMGDARGYWEGETLVVETTNFNGKAPFQGASADVVLKERFKLLDGETLSYEFTIEDPATWVRPWTVQYPMRRNPERIYEYACHENNYAGYGILAGARVEEKAASEQASPKR
jgi:hypothetical protein